MGVSCDTIPISLDDSASSVSFHPSLVSSYFLPYCFNSPPLWHWWLVVLLRLPWQACPLLRFRLFLCGPLLMLMQWGPSLLPLPPCLSAANSTIVFNAAVWALPRFPAFTTAFMDGGPRSGQGLCKFEEVYASSWRLRESCLLYVCGSWSEPRRTPQKWTRIIIVYKVPEDPLFWVLGPSEVPSHHWVLNGNSFPPMAWCLHYVNYISNNI